MKYLENDKLDLLIKLSFCDRELPDVEEFKNLDGNKFLYSSNEVLDILRRKLGFYVRQPHQKNLIILKNHKKD